MPFDSAGERSFAGRSPGGFEFGVTGWVWGEPRPTSITFFLDGSAMVCDQYGRQIRRAVTNDGRELRFADTAPEASREGGIVPRPHFAPHAQVIAALKAEGIDWLAYEVKWVDRAGQQKRRGSMTLTQAKEWQAKLIADECRTVAIGREIVCAGWPQLPYERPKDGGACLKDMAELPPTPAEELRKIPNVDLRKDALRARREADAVHEKELEAAAAE